MSDKKDMNSTGPTPASPSLDSGAQAPRASIIQLDFDDTEGCVMAHLVPSPEAPTVTLESLREQLEEEGYGHYFAPDATLQPIVLKANKAEEGDYVVAERRDARFDWHVTDDKEAVYLTVTPAYGGTEPSRETLLEALDELGVPRRCVLEAALNEVVVKGQGKDLCIAKAIQPEHGQDTQFEVLVEACKNLELTEDEQGRVDLHQLHEFVVVEPGTELMRRIPATDGKAGLNVVGEPLKPTPGRNLKMSKDTEGAQVSPDDHHLLVAAIKGHPVVIPRGVRVDPTLRLENVDLNTGNIDFDGSLEVTGDITSGFVVQASGDIFIRGTVEKARVEARRNLVITGGVIGEDLGRDKDNNLILRTHLKAGGNLSAKFINLAEAVAGENLQAREYVMQSHLRAGDAIRLGQGGGKGCLIGGRARAGRILVANILGSDAGVATDVRIGKSNPKRRLMESLKRAVELCEHNCQKLEPVLAAVEAKGNGPAPDKLAKIRNTIDDQRQRRQRLKSIIERLVERQKASQDASVEIKRQMHANVSLTIDGVSHTYSSDLGPRTLVRAGAELVTKS